MPKAETSRLVEAVETLTGQVPPASMVLTGKILVALREGRVDRLTDEPNVEFARRALKALGVPVLEGGR